MAFTLRQKKKIENAALFVRRLGLPSTLIRHVNGAFRKRSSNRRNLKTPAFRFWVDGKHFENGAFRKRRPHDNHVTSLPEVSSNTNKKCPVIVAFFKFLQRSVDGKHLMRFQGETSVLEFLRRSVDEPMI